MPLEPGAKLGGYEILASLADDSAESYKAADRQSNRTVTIKLYPAHISTNLELKQRFAREVRTIAAMKHPNICAVYDMVHEDASDYVVTEYLEGESLAERLKRGPIELEEVLNIASAIADALDKAHRQGVTHRGLNPSNIILTENGVKLTEFGFASLNGSSGSSVSASQLSTRTAFSAIASVPPAAAPYLAPEQFDGLEADARTDIFAFGAILHEMLTGRPAFEGKTQPMLLAAIQTVDPDPVTKLQPSTPPALEYLVQRCLAKDPKQRLQTARDLVIHLQWIREAPDRLAPGGIATRRGKRDRFLWLAAAALVLVTAVMAASAYRYMATKPEADEVHFVISSMGDTAVAAGGSPVTVSPDGRWIAAARLLTTNGGTYVLPLGSVTPKLILEGRVAWSLFWSPDSRSFAFFDDGKLKTSDVSGSPPQTVGDAPFPVAGGTWSKDGVIIFASGGVLHRVQAAGGQPAQISTLNPALQETEHRAPCFLPDGRHYIYLSVSSQPSNSAIYLGTLDSKEPVRLFAAESPAIYAAPGYVIFNRGTAVFAQPFDATALKTVGEPIRLSDAALRLSSDPNLGSYETRQANVAVSQSGVLVYRSAASATAPGQLQNGAGFVLTWFDRSAQGLERAGTPGPYAGIDLAPDGKRFAVHQHEGQGGDSWFFESGRMQRLTFNTAEDNSMPVWSRDGKRIAFASRRNNKWGLYVKASDGTGPEDLIIESEVPQAPTSWSPDGKLLVYWVNDPKTRGDIWMVPVAGDHKAVPLVQTPADELLAQVSPDGKWMAYQSDETGIFQIYIRPFPEGSGNKSQVSTEIATPGVWPRWRGDGKELFFRNAPNLMAADINLSGSSIQPGVPHILFPFAAPNFPGHANPYHRYAVTSDGQRFLIPQPGGGALGGGGGLAGTLATNADQNLSGVVGSVGSINVVLNWTRSLKRK